MTNMETNTVPTAMPIEQSKSGGKKSIFILLFVLLFCCIVTVVVGVVVASVGGDKIQEFFDNVQESIDDNTTPTKTPDEDTDAPTATPEETSDTTTNSYTNEEYKFTLDVPSTWNVSETGNEVVINSPLGSGQINFQALDDPTFVLLDEIDTDFCTSFGEGFREGLGDIESVEQFQFQLFTLNGNSGCKASGEIVPGVFQSHYVFFNDETDYIYSIFYTTAERAVEEDDMQDIMDSFNFI